MGLRLKSGSWQAPADGNVRVKAGGAWQKPSFVYVKANGVWNDSGWRGPPKPPTMPWVVAWNYGAVHTGFSGPSGSTPSIDFYHIERLDANGTPVEGYYDTSGERVWGVGQDSRHQFRVRSHGVNGLWSDWVGNLRVGIGHPVSYNYGYVQRSRYWGVGGSVGHEGHKDNLAGHGVPNNVICTSIHWQLWLNFGSSNICVNPPAYVDGGDRQMEIILNENYVWAYPNWPNGLDGWDYLAFWGNTGRTGFICRGGGWDRGTNGDGTGDRREVHGYVWLAGDEYYDNYEITSTNPEQGNYYW